MSQLGWDPIAEPESQLGSCHNSVMTTPSLSLPTTAVRWLRRSAVVAAALAALWIGDSAIAMKLEAQLAREIEAATQATLSPAVYIGGLPVTAAARTGDIPLIEVSADNIPTADFGLVRLRGTLRNITMSPEDFFRGRISGAQVATVDQAIVIDGASLGQLLDIPDLELSHPEDISPRGGPSTQAVLRGTIPHSDEPVAVLADFRLRSGDFFLQPHTVIEAAPGLSTEEIIAAFSWEVPAEDLPFSAPATTARLLGGALSIESQWRHSTVDLASVLAPVAPAATP